MMMGVSLVRQGRQMLVLVEAAGDEALCWWLKEAGKPWSW